MTIEIARWFRDKAIGVRVTEGELKAITELKNLDPKFVKVKISTWVRGILMDMAAEKGINRREVLKTAIEGGVGSLGGKQFPGTYEIHPDGTEYRVLPDGSISLQVYPIDLEQKKEDEELAQQSRLFSESPGEVVEFRRRREGEEKDDEVRVMHPFEAQDELDRKRLRRRRIEAGLDPETGESSESPTSGWASVDDASSHMDDEDLLALFDGDDTVLEKYKTKEAATSNEVPEP